MADETDQQGYNLPEDGESGWGALLNENFEDIDDDVRTRVSRQLCTDDAEIEEVSANVEDLVFGAGLFAEDDPSIPEIEAGDGRVLIGNGVEPVNVGEGVGEVAQGRTCGRHTFRRLRNVGTGAEVLGGFLDPTPDDDVDFRTLVGGNCIFVTQRPREIRIDYVCWPWYHPPWWPPVDDDVPFPPWWLLFGDGDDGEDDAPVTPVTPYAPDDEDMTGDEPVCTTSAAAVFGGADAVQYPFAMTDPAGEQTAWVDKEGNAWFRGTVNARDKNFVQSVDTDDGEKEVVYTSTESGTPHTETSGVAQLDDGRAVVELPDHFRWVTSAEEPLTVQTTPYSAESAGLAILDRSLERLEVADLDGTGDYEFAYTVTGTREGRADKQVVREPSDATAPSRSTVGSDD